MDNCLASCFSFFETLYSQNLSMNFSIAVLGSRIVDERLNSAFPARWSGLVTTILSSSSLP